jgi:16S rRNA (guanine1207-N2)-methyltransferase
MDRLIVPQGTFPLRRYPRQTQDPLRAWDAADEFLLQHLFDEGLPGSGELLIVNDSFGALATALSAHRPWMLSDSFLAHRGTEANLADGGLSLERVRLLTSLQAPEGVCDLVLIKIPKSLALLEDELFRLRPHLHPGSRIIGAGMGKAIHTSTLALFERILGPTTTSLARKKARLIFSSPDPALDPGTSPYPGHFRLEETGDLITNHAAVFSRERLDIGTRFFLGHLPASSEECTIVDLGCGNGVLGVVAARRNPRATLIFTDESFMAVASAEESFRAAFGERQAEFRVTDALAGIPRGSADLILNNPPFHQENVVGDQIAWRMFREAKEVLREGGELRVIGNRHLGYHVKLKRLFGNCETIAGNAKFVILKAVRRGRG